MGWDLFGQQAGQGQVARGEFVQLVRRVDQLEKAVERLAMMPMEDRARTWYHRDEYVGAPSGQTWGPPWVSKSVRFAERLTSAEFVRATGEAAVLAGVCAGAGTGIVAIVTRLPWFSAPVVGVSAFALVGAAGLIHNRTLLQQVVNQQRKAGRRREELRVQIEKPDADRRLRSVEFLLVAGITEAQLREFAAVALAGGSLAVHARSGGGALFSQPQYSALMSELVRGGFVCEASGNKSRSLTLKGRALMRGLSG